MKQPGLHDRRSVLKVLLGAGAAVGLLPEAWAADPQRAGVAWSPSRAFFRNRKGAAAVGRAYLAIREEEGEIAVLRRLLELPAEDPSSPSERKQLLTRLRARQRDDFREDRVVTVEGWLLSETEARLCALVALEDSPR